MIQPFIHSLTKKIFIEVPSMIMCYRTGKDVYKDGVVSPMGTVNVLEAKDNFTSNQLQFSSTLEYSITVQMI